MASVIRRISAFLLTLALILATAQPVYAETEPPAQEPAAAQPAGPAINARSAILMEQTTGQVLWEMNADEPMPPASITKVMTLLLVMEALEGGRLTLESQIACSEHAASMGGSQIWLEPNEEMSVDDLLKATCISSANDAAVLLAEAVAGSEESFVERMNGRAQELGMEHTVFRNACGLDEPGHQTTARDIGIMSCALLHHPKIQEYSTIWMDSLRGGETQLVNTNKLVRFYDGATGLKTGTTSGAGSCLSASASRGGLSLVAVVLGAPTSDDRFAGARKLLDYGFANYAMASPPDLSAELTPVKVLRGVAEEVPVRFDHPADIVVQKGQEQKLEQRVSLVPDVCAPVEEGQVLGQVVILLDGQTLAEYPLTAANAVERRTFWNSLTGLFSQLVRLGAKTTATSSSFIQNA